MVRTWRRTLASLPYLAIVAVIAILPLFISNLYYIQVLIFIGIYIILALSLNLLNGYVGLLSIGHAAFYGIGAYASAKLVMEAGVPFPLAMLGSGMKGGFRSAILPYREVSKFRGASPLNPVLHPDFSGCPVLKSGCR